MINPEAAKSNFRRACEQYDEAKEIIRELSSFVQIAQKDFSFDKAVKQFDLILQAILLNTAAEDGHFLDEEKQFIEKITDYADLMAFISRKHDVNISWDSYGTLTSEKRKDLALKILADLDDMAQNFVLPFALVDALLPKDYCEELTEKMSLIGACLAGCDGDDVESECFKKELIMAFVLIQKSIREKWKAVVDKAEQHQGSSSAAKSSGKSTSLKDVYLKKNK